eukprot:comp9445_c0_seq1/m.4500 comp9445_c0_seq1/g.4500  ORF comp9445_c0_seq1/g.4500 comp9445_c0_seq1/m.4500 type:complete len:207 (-) comp9445_c0_seq1:584-1204(-)
MSSEDGQQSFPQRSYDESDPSIMSVPVFAQGSSVMSPYAQQFGGALPFQVAGGSGDTDYLFPEDSHKKRSMFEKLGVRTGVSYLVGSSVGGVWGLAEGLRNPDATTRRLKINSVLNAVTRRGPFVGNFSAVLALMYTFMDEAIITARGGDDDVINTVASGVLTGILFKATAGPRAMALAGAVGGAFVGLGVLAKQTVGPKITNILI